MSFRRWGHTTRSDCIFNRATQHCGRDDIMLCSPDLLLQLGLGDQSAPAMLATTEMRIESSALVSGHFIVHLGRDQLLSLVATHWLLIRSALS